MSKVKLWNAVCETNPQHTTKVDQRGGFTAISAQYQLKNATEQFGPFGIGFGLKNLEYKPINIVSDSSGSAYASINTVMMQLTAEFWYTYDKLVGSFPISTAIIAVKNGKPDHDFAKKAETDLLTKALSRLGFNADVFMGRFDDNKYVETMNRKHNEMVVQDKVREFIDRGFEKAETAEHVDLLEKALKDKAKKSDGAYYWIKASKDYFKQEKAIFLQSLEQREQLDQQMEERVGG